MTENRQNSSRKEMIHQEMRISCTVSVGLLILLMKVYICMFVCVSVCLCGTLPLDERELTEQFHEGDDSSGDEDIMYCECGAPHPLNEGIYMYVCVCVCVCVWYPTPG